MILLLNLVKYKVNFELSLKKNPYKGLYIALEGIDGCGKTTQVERVAQYFRDQGCEVVTTREPRKEGILGDIIHKVLLGKEKLPTASIQYLFTADRVANHHSTVLPALERGAVVITDRCLWSAVVYGILDRTGGVYDKNDADVILISQGILSMYHQFIIPDYTFYLKVSVEESMRRLRAKDDTKEIYEEESNIAKLYTGYNYLKERFPEELKVIDGEMSIEKVTQQILNTVTQK
jgi:dTMP kinase